VAVFARQQPRAHRHVKMRVRALAFVARKLSPLELQTVRVHVAPAIPDMLEELHVEEECERGSVLLGGQSALFDVAMDQHVTVSLGGGELPHESQHQPWHGEPLQFDFDFDPEQMLPSLHEAMLQADAADEAAHTSGTDEGKEQEQGDLRAEGEAEPLLGTLPLLVETGGPARLVHGRSKDKFSRHSRDGISADGHAFGCDVTIHIFPPPMRPTNLRVHARTQSALEVRWAPPIDWGGCALTCYEIEYRKPAGDVTKPWVPVGSVDPRLDTFTIYENIFNCDVRVRARNVGALRPGPWSLVLHVAPPKVEEALNKRGKRPKGREGRRGERPGTAADSISQQGMAVVEQEGLQVETRWQSTGRAHIEAEDWSEFATAVGEYYLEIGVNGGCVGKLFDLTPLQVEELTMSTFVEASDHIDEEKPLLSLAVIASWVLQTLAHHSAEPDEWVPFCNDVAGLVNLAAGAVSEDAAVVPMAQGLLSSLLCIYESVYQCDEEGYITRQRGYKYEKKLKKAMQQDWEEHHRRLKEGVAMYAMELVLYGRFKEFGLKKQLGEAEAAAAKAAMRRTKSVGYRQKLQAREEEERQAEEDERQAEASSGC